MRIPSLVTAALGLVASRSSLGAAMALASVVYIAAGLLLIVGMVFFVKRDIERCSAGP